METIEEIVTAAATVPGWTTGEDAKAVALTSLALPDGATIVEVGVYMGRSTVLLAGARRLRGNGRVHCVDPFDCSGDAFSVPHYRDLLAQSGLDSLEPVFRQHMARLRLEKWIEVHKGTQLEVAARWSGPIDLLLLDADHSRAAARAGYEAWIPFLRRGGTLVVRNTRDREYAEDHDGNRMLVIEEVHAPRFGNVRQVGATTFAVKDLE